MPGLLNKMAVVGDSLFNLFAEDKYGEIGYFVLNNPRTSKYRYANWGSRKWEYYYVEKLLDEINIEDKHVVDIGIGIPADSDFFKYYIKSNCRLTAFDPDERLDDVTVLSEKCRILRKYADETGLDSGSVDVVVAISSLEHFPAGAFHGAIEEMHRILKPDGHFIVTLDLTYNKKTSARWAILEKTLNSLPPSENDEQLNDCHRQLTPEYFLELVSPYFYTRDYTIYNKGADIRKLVYSKKWNSHIAYFHLYKKG